MIKRLLWGLFFAAIAFVVSAVAAYFLVLEFSPNPHDRELEAAMTSVFFYGPVGAVVAFVAAMMLGGRRASASRE